MSFLEYKNKHKGEIAYIISSGPTLDNFKEQEPGVYIGVNFSFRNDTIRKKISYAFVEDPCGRINNLGPNVNVFHLNISKTKNCKCESFEQKVKWYDLKDISGKSEGQLSASRYYDLRVSKRSSTTAFYAFFFALYCGFKKIYLVGCDCANTGYATKCDNKGGNYKGLIIGWKTIKEITKHDGVEIISINPVGLKDVFPSITL